MLISSKTINDINGVNVASSTPTTNEQVQVPLLELDGSSSNNSAGLEFVIDSAEDAVEFASKQIKLDVNSSDYELFKFDVTNKYNTMLRVAAAKGETLDQAVIQLRISNYAKGWKFNQFEQNAVKGKKPDENWVYEASKNATKEELFKNLKQHYNQFADEYIEFYDGDASHSIDLIEMFKQELVENYVNKGMSPLQAQKKAINVAIEYNKKSFNEIDNSSDTSDEMTLYKLLLTKFGTLEDYSNGVDINSLRTLDKDEVQAYLFTKAQYDNRGENTITPQESVGIEKDIMLGNGKTPKWLVAARQFLGL